MYHYVTVLLLGTRMRWVPELSCLKGQNDRMKKVTLLRGHQSQFKAMTNICVNDELTMMDQGDIGNGRVLRDFIIELMHPLTGVQKSHSVSKIWRSSKCMFHFIPVNVDMVVMITE